MGNTTENNNDNSVDIKNIQTPNICFSLTGADDKREMIFRQQRIERGFDDSETWSLRYTIASFIIPRLERYQEVAKGFLKREPELVDNIEVFLKAMKLVVREDKGEVLSADEENQIEQGLELFPKVFMTLWW